MGTPDPHRELHKYMVEDDVGWPGLSCFDRKTKPMWAHFIVFYLFWIIDVNIFIWWTEPNNYMFLGFAIYMPLHSFWRDFQWILIKCRFCKSSNPLFSLLSFFSSFKAFFLCLIYFSKVSFFYCYFVSFFVFRIRFGIRAWFLIVLTIKQFRNLDLVWSKKTGTV